MPIRIMSVAAVLLAAASIIAACSQNAGFGAPPVPGPPAQPQANGISGSPGAGQNGIGASSSPAGATDQALSIASATARYAYDGSESDPVKAPRLVELAFALKNPGLKTLTVAKISVAGESNVAVGNAKTAVSVGPGATSDVFLIAIKPNKDAPTIRTATMTFADDKGTVLAVGTADLPPADLPLVPLDEKDPKGGLTVDGVEVTAVQAPGSGPHYEITFAMTNAGAVKADMDAFTIVAPKTGAVKVAVPLSIPPRNTTGFISIVMPFKGKALPDGDYTINATAGAATIAKASGTLL